MKVTKQLIQCRALDISLIIYSFSLAGAYLSSDFLEFWWLKVPVSLAMMIIGYISIILPYKMSQIAFSYVLYPLNTLQKWTIVFVIFMWILVMSKICGIF